MGTWDPTGALAPVSTRMLRFQWVDPAMDWVAATEVADDFHAELIAVADDARLSDEIRSRAQRLGGTQ